MTARPTALHFPPIGLSRVQAAEHVGVSPDTFDKMVEAGAMPQPRRWGRRVLWARTEVEEAFLGLPGGSVPDDIPEPNDFDGLHDV